MDKQTQTTPSPETGKRRGWRPLQTLAARPRLSIASVVFVVLGAGLLVAGLPWARALLLGFDVGALVFVAGVWRLFNQAGPTQMREVAQRQDTGRWGILWSTLAITAIIVLALVTELQAGKSGGIASIVVAGSSIVLSWLFMNVMFALHYAHGFYGDYGKEHEGLDFPGKQAPDYWDFAYFSIVIGMTFQVSDVQITSRTLRRLALMHSVVAFFFNMFIIAVTVNILAGQA
jgi:uncharacterized membrane protein